MTSTSDGPVAGSPNRPDQQDPPSLGPTVSRLRDEVDGLRAAMRSRSVIEQAKGMLMERYGCDSEAAFERLRRLSQHANVKLSDVAAALVDTSSTGRPVPLSGKGSSGKGSAVRGASATASPPRPQRSTSSPAAVARAAQRIERNWPRRSGEEDDFAVGVRARARRAMIRTALLEARSARDVLDAVVGVALAGHPGLAAVLAFLDTNGVVRLIAGHGTATAQADRWGAVPLDLDLPICTVIRTASPLWLDAGSGELGLGLPQEWAAAAVLPLVESGVCIGALGVTWAGSPVGDLETEVPTPTATERAELEQIAAGSAVAVRRMRHLIAPGAGQPMGMVPGPVSAAVALLDATVCPVLLCRALLDELGRVSDLVVVHATPATTDPAGRGPAEFTDRRLLELFPESVDDGLFSACLQVMATGSSVDLPAFTWTVTARGSTSTSLVDMRVSRYRGGAMLSWLPVDQGATAPADRPEGVR